MFIDHDIHAGELSEVIESAIDTFYMLFYLETYSFMKCHFSVPKCPKSDFKATNASESVHKLKKNVPK